MNLDSEPTDIFIGLKNVEYLKLILKYQLFEEEKNVKNWPFF